VKYRKVKYTPLKGVYLTSVLHGISGYVALAVSVGTAVVGVVNHKRIRSNCCGKKTEASLDIENTIQLIFCSFYII
jgi:hypothetical protein